MSREGDYFVRTKDTGNEYVVLKGLGKNKTDTGGLNNETHWKT